MTPSSIAPTAHERTALAPARERELWSSMVPRLYAVAVGSVLFSFVVAFLAALLASPPPPPWIVRSASRQLVGALDRDAALGPAVDAFAEAVGHGVLVFRGDAVVAVSGGVDVDFARAARAAGVVTTPDVVLSAGDPFFDENGRRKKRRLPFLPQGDSAFTTRLTSPAGVAHDVVFVRTGEVRGFAVFVGGMLVALGALSAAFARLLTGPLRELTRAVDAFGRGDVDVDVDEAKVGPYAPLARMWNAMTVRVAAARRNERELLANVSHELRTPLARVRVAVELAREEVHDAAVVKEALADVDVDLAELQTMIDDVLTAARFESQGVAAVSAVDVDVGTVVAAARDRFRARFPRHVLEAHAPPAGLWVRGDALLLRRALTNLLDNAGKYSEPGSRVVIDVHVGEDAVAVAVRDSGIGVAAADQARLFEPFFRAEKSRTRAAGGVGLGLVIAKRVAEAHGGRVSFVSAPGAGSTVTLHLPRIAHA